MIFNLKKEIGTFLAIFLVSCFLVFLFLNGGAYLKIWGYNETQSILDFQNSSKIQIAQSKENYHLYIPKIGVSAPIVLPKDDSNQNILASLEEGVALYPGSQLPGETGRSVVLGHSSKATWYRGQYGYIFALLSKLQSGDEFYIVFKNKKLIYKVFSNDILTPEQTNELLSQTPKNESDAVLITCWPIGSSSMRTLIQAQLNRVEKI